MMSGVQPILLSWLQTGHAPNAGCNALRQPASAQFTPGVSLSALVCSPSRLLAAGCAQAVSEVGFKARKMAPLLLRSAC